MSKKNPGGVIGPSTLGAPSVTNQNQNSGVWSLPEQYQAAKAGDWANPSGQSYQIPGSLRFESSYIKKTPATAGNQKTWTWSGWMRKSEMAAHRENQNTILDVYVDNSNRIAFWWGDNANDAIGVYGVSGGSVICYLYNTQAFRDISGWYHLIIAVDTTNANARDRVKFYINGKELIDGWSQTTWPSQNTNLFINSTNQHTIAGGQYNSAVGPYYFAGYMTEVYFLDGYQAKPEQFGYFDSQDIWQPKPYVGPYGLNGYYLPMTTGPKISTYFGNSGYIQTATNTTYFELAQAVFSIEYWENRINPAGGDTGVTFSDGTQTYASLIGYYDGSVTRVYMSGNNSSWNLVNGLSLGASIPGQWSHILVTRDATGEIRGFRDGVLKFSTNIGTSAGITQNANQVTIGRAQSSNYYTGYISNVRFCKLSIPTAYQTSSTTVGTVVFTPPNDTVTTTSQGATAAHVNLITCTGSDISTNLGTPGGSLTSTGVSPQRISPFYASPFQDYSGNSNSWNPYNVDLDTSGTNQDAMVESPTNGSTSQDTGLGGEVPGTYAILNQLASVGTYADGGLRWTGQSSGDNCAVSTIGVTSGKWYWEVYPASLSNLGTNGVIYDPSRSDLTTSGGYTSPNGFAMDWSSNPPLLKHSGTSTSYGTAITSLTDTVMVALDLDNRKLYFGLNGTWFGSSNPATGTNAAVTSLATGKTWFAHVGDQWGSASSQWKINFGQQIFNYQAPSGFKCLCTTNLPESQVENPRDHFNVVKYTGTGDLSINNVDVGFAPDFSWLKSNTQTYNHLLFDTLRPKSTAFNTNTTNAEAVDAGFSFTDTGFSLFSSGGTASNEGSQANGNMLSWNWKAGGSTSNTNPYMRDGVPFTPTHGTITATRISANTKAGFSIITGRTLSTGTLSYGHGLGVTPAMVIYRSRVSSGQNTWVWHQSLPNAATGRALRLNTDDAEVNGAYFGTPSVSSTVVTVAGAALNSDDFISYVFAEIAGYSKFGSFTGNSDSDGPYIYCGFRPAFILFKANALGYTWYLTDRLRPGYNSSTHRIEPNTNYTSYTNDVQVDYLSNGFKLKTGNTNYSGTVLYAAFADVPYKRARAR